MANDLRVMNTYYKHKNYGTWQHARTKKWHMIDLIVNRQRDANRIKNVRVMCDAECDTDHRLIIADVKTKRVWRGKKKDSEEKRDKRPARLNTGELAKKEIRKKLLEMAQPAKNSREQRYNV